MSKRPPYVLAPRRLPIDLKTINAMMFIKFLTLEIETACADPKTVGSHAAEGLKLDPALKHFQKHYVDVEVSEYVPGPDSGVPPHERQPLTRASDRSHREHAADWARLRENFDVERWLVPFVKAFLLQSHQKVLDWAKKAIELDDVRGPAARAGGRRLGGRLGGCGACGGNRFAGSPISTSLLDMLQFKPVTADAGYSTSVVDLFNIITSVRDAATSPMNRRCAHLTF